MLINWQSQFYLNTTNTTIFLHLLDSSISMVLRKSKRQKTSIFTITPHFSRTTPANLKWSKEDLLPIVTKTSSSLNPIALGLLSSQAMTTITKLKNKFKPSGIKMRDWNLSSEISRKKNKNKWMKLSHFWPTCWAKTISFLLGSYSIWKQCWAMERRDINF